ncbi:fatty acid desaturase family protein [Streptomyces sp. NRRL F-5123]|uniref:fatty acid desaturase family protein n=1 Tax=Streptomyces sp. NRRL F-5123 TaxID=1463856 RepID=UPI00131BEC2B|nr:fatty acid desaturase family protein [Streptomyces sp. NRRL F-5123]
MKQRKSFAGVFSDTPYPRGYRVPPELGERIAAAHRTRPVLTVGAALLDHAVAMGAVLAAAAWAGPLPWPVRAVVYAVAAVVVGRQLRALECLVHEGAHRNWTRKHRTANDVLAFVLAAAPTGASLPAYRTSHFQHHRRFGTTSDPDLERYAELDVEGMRRNSAAAFAADLLRRLPRYEAGWLRTLGSDPLLIAMPLTWPTVTALPAAASVIGWRRGATALVCWILGYLVVLPVIRFAAESAEHVYSTADTVFDATVTNNGRFQRFAFHPHNDGFHTVHHLWPGIPHHALRRVHELLCARDADGYGRRVLVRSALLDRPVAADPTGGGPPRVVTGAGPRRRGAGAAGRVRQAGRRG